MHAWGFCHARQGGLTCNRQGTQGWWWHRQRRETLSHRVAPLLCVSPMMAIS